MSEHGMAYRTRWGPEPRDLRDWIRQYVVDEAGLDLQPWQVDLITAAVRRGSLAGAQFDAMMTMIRDTMATPPANLRRQAEEMYQLASGIAGDETAAQ